MSTSDKKEISIGSLGTLELSPEAIEALKILNDNGFSPGSVSELSDKVIEELNEAGLFVNSKPCETLPFIYRSIVTLNPTEVYFNKSGSAFYG